MSYLKTEGQYHNADKLNKRISIHEKYSVNRFGFSRWILSQYEIAPGSRILELGCGTGHMWKEGIRLLTGGSTLLLSDFSAGMLKSAQEELAGAEGVSFAVIDAQEIPFPDESFNIVIANMMLYHVPDLHKALSEAARVLKPGGKFYAATFGEHGIMAWVNDLLSEMGVSGNVGGPFTLQNGEEILKKHFSSVCRTGYEDALAVTEAEDLADYIYSLSELSGIEQIPREELTAALEARMTDGILHVPKEYGLFICKK